jgi:hypothetical protein
MPDQAPNSNQPYEDPGWLPALKGFGAAFFRRSPGGVKDGVTIARVLFLSLLLSAFLILFVLSFAIERVGDPETPAWLAVASLGLVGAAAAAWTSKRPLDVGSSSTLAASYRTNFFLGFASSEAPLLMSFVVCFVLDERWPYLVALPFFALGMAVIGPTRLNLERRQQQIERQGSDLSIGRALSHVQRPSGDVTP